MSRNYRKQDGSYQRLSSSGRKRRIVVEDSSSSNISDSSESSNDEEVEREPSNVNMDVNEDSNPPAESSSSELPEPPLVANPQPACSLGYMAELPRIASDSDSNLSSESESDSDDSTDYSYSAGSYSEDSGDEASGSDEASGGLDDSSNSNDSSSDDDISKVVDGLRKTAIEHGITVSGIGGVSRSLRESHPHCFGKLPVTGRTIMRTPRERVDLDDVAPGKYFHIGIAKQILYVLALLSITALESVSLLFNIDGVPCGNSSFSQLWPILMSFPTIPQLRDTVFPVGIYAGRRKPDSVESFLRRFVNELKKLLNEGILFKDRVVSITILGFVCDSPARAYIMSTIGHTGFFACSRCTVEGVSTASGKGNKRVYPETDRPRRNDNGFRNREDTKYQPDENLTPLAEIPQIDFGFFFILDYMHLLCLGVMKTLLTKWLFGKKPHKFSSQQVNAFREHIRRLKPHIPCEFSRKLQDIGTKTLHWKAKEYRLFLLYVGVVMLKDYLKDDKYNHFLALHIAATILLGKKFCPKVSLRQYARQLLVHFVERGAQLYSLALLVLNFHLLIHLVDDADNYCHFFAADFSLNLISSFPFENFLGKLQKLARGRSRTLQQLSKRLEEMSRAKLLGKLYKTRKESKFSLRGRHYDGPLPLFFKNPQYKVAIFPEFKINTSNIADCYCGLSNGDIVKAENFAYSQQLKEVVLIGKKFKDLSDYYGEPSFMKSSDFGIFQGKKLSGLMYWKTSEITTKYMALPTYDQENNLAFFPLHHC